MLQEVLAVVAGTGHRHLPVLPEAGHEYPLRNPVELVDEVDLCVDFVAVGSSVAEELSILCCGALVVVYSERSLLVCIGHEVHEVSIPQRKLAALIVHLACYPPDSTIFFVAQSTLKERPP